MTAELGVKLSPVSPADLFDQMKGREARMANIQPVNQSQRYAVQMATRQDQVIHPVSARPVPPALALLISVEMRDEGNALIAESCEFNNACAGRTIFEVRADTVGDLYLLDLRDRVLSWTDRLCDALKYKLRRQFDQDPIRTFCKIYGEFLMEFDQKIAHGQHSVTSLVWAYAMDTLPYRLLTECFIDPGRITMITQADGSRWRMASKFPVTADEQLKMQTFFDIYNVFTHEYAKKVVLAQLIDALKTMPLPSDEVLPAHAAACFADLLEAFPYLVSSKRLGTMVFTLPTGIAVSFEYATTGGFATFSFYDNETARDLGIKTCTARAILELHFNGQISLMLLPTITLEHLFGARDGCRIAYWLLKAAHDLVVPSYLKISSEYMAQRAARFANAASPVVATDQPDVAEASVEEPDYSDWLFECATQAPPSVTDSENPDMGTVPRLPQMRRTRLFRLLGHCGVTVEQGKGSELKLLRPRAHPFRLGNHYGPNPTVPSFLIASILKRMEITREEWFDAIRRDAPIGNPQ